MRLPRNITRQEDWLNTNFPEVLSFGKYRNVPIEDIPFSYLEWCVDNIDSIERPGEYHLIEQEYIKRKNGVI